MFFFTRYASEAMKSLELKRWLTINVNWDIDKEYVISEKLKFTYIIYQTVKVLNTVKGNPIKRGK